MFLLKAGVCQEVLQCPRNFSWKVSPPLLKAFTPGLFAAVVISACQRGIPPQTLRNSSNIGQFIPWRAKLPPNPNPTIHPSCCTLPRGHPSLFIKMRDPNICLHLSSEKYVMYLAETCVRYMAYLPRMTGRPRSLPRNTDLASQGVYTGFTNTERLGLYSIQTLYNTQTLPTHRPG